MMNTQTLDTVLQVVGAVYLCLSILANIPGLSKTKVAMILKTVVADLGPVLSLVGLVRGKPVVPDVPKDE